VCRSVLNNFQALGFILVTNQGKGFCSSVLGWDRVRNMLS
jgi:hypothetical protein